MTQSEDSSNKRKNFDRKRKHESLVEDQDIPTPSKKKLHMTKSRVLEDLVIPSSKSSDDLPECRVSIHPLHSARWQTLHPRLCRTWIANELKEVTKNRLEEEQERAIKLERDMAKMKHTISKLKREREKKDNKISELERDREKKKNTISEQEKKMAKKDNTISKLKRDRGKRDDTISELEKVMVKKDITISKLKKDMAKRENTIRKVLRAMAQQLVHAT